MSHTQSTYESHLPASIKEEAAIELSVSSLGLTHTSHLDKLCLVLLEATKEVLTLFVIFTVCWQTRILVDPVEHNFVPHQAVLWLQNPMVLILNRSVLCGILFDSLRLTGNVRNWLSIPRAWRTLKAARPSEIHKR